MVRSIAWLWERGAGLDERARLEVKQVDALERSLAALFPTSVDDVHVGDSPDHATGDPHLPVKVDAAVPEIGEHFVTTLDAEPGLVPDTVGLAARMRHPVHGGPVSPETVRTTGRRLAQRGQVRSLPNRRDVSIHTDAPVAAV